MDTQNETELIYVLTEVNEEEEPPSSRVIEIHRTEDFKLITNLPASRISNERIKVSENSKAFMENFYPEATEKDWSNWNWQIKNSITNLDQLKKVFDLTEDEIKPISDKNNSLPLRITPYYVSLLSKEDPNQPLRRSVIPTNYELIQSEGEASDPLSEEHDSPVANLVHRYPDRVLFLSTGFCSTYCRYCTRSHMVAKEGKCHIGTKAWQEAFEYIRNHKEIRDVLISGGDPLTMPDSHIEYLLKNIRSISHVEIIRIGTKVPAVLPQRITKSLINILKKYHPLFISVHFTHPDELTPETIEACERLADAGIPLGSQTVLLKGINDNIPTMKKLFHDLLKIRVRPYYLYQCDPILGSAHFRTPVSKGLEIIKGLRGYTTGYAVPQYVIDAPGGGGKIPLLPDYFQEIKDDNIVLKNFENNFYQYPDYIKE